MSGTTHLIIAGTTKAGTTSLFNYLADHPAICASNVKETRFFLEPEYPLPSIYRLEDGIERYTSFFNHCNMRPIRLEATPDYLYSRLAPLRICTSLSKVRLIFILRDPVERLISWYRFAKQLGQIDQATSFDGFIQLQNLNPEMMSGQQYQDALIQGHYSFYLARFYALFDPQQICLVQQETLAQQPRRVLEALCDFAHIDAALYAGYEFKIFNRTQHMRSVHLHRAYLDSIRWMRQRVHDNPTIRGLLRRARRAVEPHYLNMNRSEDDEVPISPAVRQYVGQVYREEPMNLARLLNVQRFSWQDLQTPVHIGRLRAGGEGQQNLLLADSTS